MKRSLLVLAAVLAFFGPAFGQVPGTPPMGPPSAPPPPLFVIWGSVQAVNGSPLPSVDMNNVDPGWASIQMILFEFDSRMGHQAAVAFSDCSAAFYPEGRWQGCADPSGFFAFTMPTFSKEPLEAPAPGTSYILQIWGNGYVTRWVRVPDNGYVGSVKLDRSPIENPRAEGATVSNGSVRYTIVFQKPVPEKMQVKIKTHLYGPTIGLPYGLMNFEQSMEANAFTNWAEIAIPIPSVPDLPGKPVYCAEVVISHPTNPLVQYSRTGFCTDESNGKG